VGVGGGGGEMLVRFSLSLQNMFFDQDQVREINNPITNEERTSYTAAYKES